MSMSMIIAVALGAVATPGAHSPSLAEPPAQPASEAATLAESTRDEAVTRTVPVTWGRGTDWDDYLLKLRRLAGAPMQLARADDVGSPLRR